MKFLCVSCDEAMKLKQTERPENGSLTVIFECPSCGWETAMLTNPMETQMVRSLGVKIGGRTVEAEPMEMVRSSLKDARDPGSESPHEMNDAETGSRCPFTGVVSEAFAQGSEKLSWTTQAEQRLERIPSFARPMARKGIEMHAREKGYTEIDNAVLDEVKDRFGM